ncbi:MAG: hypothetical protein AAF560_25105 [Acidobacteriota bacterium]
MTTEPSPPAEASTAHFPETGFDAKAMPVLSAAECDAVNQAIHECRPSWTRMDDNLPMYTLGAAAYVEGGSGREANYLAKAREINPMLHERFGWLYERLAETVSRAVGEPARYDAEHLSLPGFHVFLAHPAFTRPVASIHFDIQYEYIDWRAHPGLDFSRQLSMTLSIRLPASGGGLKLWDLDFDTYEKMSPAEQRHFKDGRENFEIMPYQEGSMVIHSGFQLHQIAPAREMREGDQRITLQTHAVHGDRRER